MCFEKYKLLKNMYLEYLLKINAIYHKTNPPIVESLLDSTGHLGSK